MIKNISGQSIGAQIITAADGSIFTGAVSVSYTLDNGVQAAGGGVAPAHEGGGYYSYSPLQAETDAEHVAYTFSGTGAISVTVQVYTQFPQTVDNDVKISELQAQVGNISTGSAAISKRAASSVTTVGVPVGGTTYTNTYTLDGIYHSVADSAGNINIEYTFDVGGSGVAVEAVMDGYFSGNGDVLTVQAYNYIGAVWESVGTMVAASGTENGQVRFNLDIEHTGIGANAGEIKVRAYEAAGGLSAVQLNMDRVFISYSIVSQSVGYDGAQVWINTVSGTAGTEVYVNGVADNPVNTLADAITLGDSVGLSRFNSSPDSIITFTETHNEEIWMGAGWTLNLGGQDVSQTHINHCNDVSGVGTCAGGEVHILNSHVGTTSLGQAHLTGCSLGSSLTLTQAADYTLENCKSGIAGATSPVIDMGLAVGATNLAVRGWNGGLTINNLALGDVVTLDGTFGTITLNGADAQVEMRGIAKAVVNNLTGTPTVNDDTLKQSDIEAIMGATFDTATDSLEAIRNRGDAAWTTGAGGSSPTVQEIRAEIDLNSTKLISIVADTNELQLNQGNWLTATGFSTFNSVTDQVVASNMRGTDGANTVVPPSVVEFNARTLPTASYSTFNYTVNEVQADINKINGVVITGNGTTAPFDAV